jgi:NAD-dependent protein deacetylase/lipoamidase
MNASAPSSDIDRLNEKIDRVVRMLRHSHSVMFITGAGISADSGLPTYRGIGGLYEEAVVEEGISIELALSGMMMQLEPRLCWKYVAQIERACRGASYNRGHEVLVEMEARFQRTLVLTQNVDGFHRAAGSRNLIEIHGDLRQLRCPHCTHRRHVPDYSELELPPACPECGAILRPDVVLFGEMLPLEKLYKLEQELQRGFDLIFSIGTSSAFDYVAQPILEAQRAGIPTVEINPGVTEVSHLVEVQVPARAAEVLDAVWTRFTAG